MYASSIGRKTIAVECFQPNLERLARAVQIENVSKYVIVVGNAIYNESRKWLQLTKHESNVGAQRLMMNQPRKYSTSFPNEFQGSLERKKKFIIHFLF